MHHKSHSYVPSTPSNSLNKSRMMEHRNSTPAIHLKMDADKDRSISQTDSLDSLTSLSLRTRHPTWSHSQLQEHRRKLSQFRARAESVSKSTQTETDNGVMDVGTSTLDSGAEKMNMINEQIEASLEDNDDGYCTYHG